MMAFFQQTLTRLGHLSDETITKLIDGELASMHEFRAKAHLGKCWQCKSRRESLEKAAFQVVEYRKHRLERRLPLSQKRRQAFFERLDEVLEETAAASSWWSRMPLQLRSFSIPHMNPVFASVFVISAAILLLVLIWQRNVAPVSASVFLEKAVQEEARQSSPTVPGVIYQKVEIKTKSKTFERALYRDVSHKRRPRAEQVKAEEATVRGALAAAGVDWEQPLSAEAFKKWHDQQFTAEDKVQRSGNDLLTLTTALPSGPIATESLTVRARDFHAVSRTVSMRDEENIEVAEVHYDVLGWDAVNETLFEPLGGGAGPSIASVLPHLPSPEQLDLAELQARLVLNHLHADSTEQLEFLRSQTSVEIRGVVESNARKQELISQLRAVPHIVPAIFSVDELRTHAEAGNAVSSIRSYSTMDEASPLEQLLRAQGKGTEMLNAISQQLLDAALSVKQESSAIAELYQRFGDGAQLDEDGKSTLQQLLVTHASRLRQAVEVEDRILSENGIALPEASSSNMPSTAEEPLTTTAENNMGLAKELITGKDGPQRDAAQIAAELFRSTQQLRGAIHGIADGNTSSGETSSPLPQKR